MISILQVFYSVFSGLLLSLAIPNEYYLHGVPFLAFIAIIPLYKKYRDLVPKLNSYYDQRGKMFAKKQDDVERVLNTKINKEDI